MRTTVARAPTSTSVSVVSGPIVAPCATTVAPSSWVPGSTVTSGARSVSTSIQVVAGSTIVTPARIQRSSTRRLSSAPSRASWARSLTPSVCQTSARSWPATSRPSERAMATTSVRYSSPWALCPGDPAEGRAQQLGVEGVDAGVDLADRPLRLVGVLLLDDAEHRAVGVAQHPAVAGRVVDGGGHDGDRGAAARVPADQVAQGGGLQQGYVAVRHQDGAADLGDRVERALDGPAGAGDVVLVDHDRARVEGLDLGGDLVPTVPDDDHELVPGRRRGRRPSRGRAGCDHRSDAGPSESPTSCGCLRQRRGRRRPRAGGRSRGAAYPRVTSLPVSRSPVRACRLATRAPRDGIEPSSLILIQSQAGPASRPTGERRFTGYARSGYSGLSRTLAILTVA